MTDEPAGAPATSDFHLVETRGVWRLTIRITDRLLAALDSTTAEHRRAESSEFTVHVEPNLLPGRPFEVSVETVADGVTGAAGQRGRRDRSDRNGDSRPARVPTRPTTERNAQ